MQITTHYNRMSNEDYQMMMAESEAQQHELLRIKESGLSYEEAYDTIIEMINAGASAAEAIKDYRKPRRQPIGFV